MKKLMLSAFALAAVVLSASAQSNVVLGTSDATLITKLEITTTGAATGFGGTNVGDGNLSFGSIGIGALASTVSVGVSSLGGARTSTGDASVVQSSSFTAAAFKVVGEVSKTYSITLPGSDLVTDGTNNLALDNFAFYTKNGASTTQGSLALTGTDYFLVGARLSIPTTAVAGAYTGDFNVTVNYN